MKKVKLVDSIPVVGTIFYLIRCKCKKKSIFPIILILSLRDISFICLIILILFFYSLT